MKSPTLWLTLLVVGCSGPQSILDPAGPSAAAIHRLGIPMYIVAAIVTLLVTALMLVPFVRTRQPESPPRRKLFLWGGGVALPVLVLTALVPYVFSVGRETRAPAAATSISIDVTGHQYWWEVAYRARGPGDDSTAITANELWLPVGEPVELVLRSTDVIHSFWVPRLAGKTDLIPGRVNRMVIQADRPGVFGGQCAEYCGQQHALMAFDITVVPRADFDLWLSKLAQPADEPSSPERRAGRDLFVRLGCGTCHTVRGVTEGRRGPDLTLVGARRTIGAGTLPGGVGNILAWIAGAQRLKPGNAMPSFNQLDSEQLRVLAEYLESLK